MSELGILSLSNNALGGPIPASLGKLQMLSRLEIMDADLVSTLPPELGNLTSLQRMYLSGNRLHGSIPPCLAKMQQIVAFDLSGNNLNGVTPPELFTKWTMLQLLDLSNNSFSGSASRQLVVWPDGSPPPCQ
jgi:Leucine-rich repeat (LRR) protein